MQLVKNKIATIKDLRKKAKQLQALQEKAQKLIAG